MKGRIMTSDFLWKNRPAFIAQLCQEIEKAFQTADRDNRELVLNLNKYSDIPWERDAWGAIPQKYPHVLFFDFTRLFNRVGQTPPNYHLLPSWTERPADQQKCLALLHAGFSCAVVFAEPGKFASGGAFWQRLPKRWVLPGDDHVWPVHDGDQSEMKFPGMVPYAPKPNGKGYIIGLRLRSDSNAVRQQAIASGFCVSVATECQNCGAMVRFETESPVKCACGKMVSHRTDQPAKSVSTDVFDFTTPTTSKIVVEHLSASSHPARDTGAASGTRHTAGRDATVPMTETELLPCPKCGEQRRAKVEWIGSTEVCDCGQIYRFSLALTKVPAETDSANAQFIQHVIRGWNTSLEFSQREIVPRIKQAWIYTCEQIAPCIVSSLTAAYAGTEKAIRDAFKPGTPPRPDFRKTCNEPVNSDWVEVPVSPDRTKDTLSAVTSPMPLVELLNDSLTPMPITDSATSEDSAAESSNPQWKKYHQLALQSLNAGVYQDAYTYAAKAIELEPDDALAWCAKGLAAAYISVPPDFRLNEVRLCINEASKFTEIQTIFPSVQDHIFTAVRGYRELVDKAYGKARDDAQKEPLTNEVNIGLQLTLRNKRVEKVSNELHAKGYMSSVDAIMFARDLAPTLVASKKALVEIDKILGGSRISSFTDPNNGITPRQRVVASRQKLIADIQNLEPTFQPPEPPQVQGCFIATAAAGDANHSAVIQLRHFRDEVLLKFSIGRQFVHSYYQFSPAAARVIEQSAFLRRIVCFGLVVPAAIVAGFILRCCTHPARE